MKKSSGLLGLNNKIYQRPCSVCVPTVLQCEELVVEHLGSSVQLQGRSLESRVSWRLEEPPLPGFLEGAWSGDQPALTRLLCSPRQAGEVSSRHILA